MSQMRRTRRRENQVRTVHNDAARHFAPADAGRLEPEAPTERTHKTSQRDIAAATSANAAANAWRQPLTRGPYSVKFSRTGRHAVLAGHGGHARVLDLHENRATCDVRPGEIVRDACFLHDERLFAVAQKKYVYVYDDTGAEVHRMQQHLEPEHLEFLPFHFLLASAGHSGFLKYHDVSTGQLVAELNTRLGSARSMAQNPQTAVLALGHGNGVATLWSPAQSKPLARLLCHRGAVDAIACSADGTLLATGGVDGLVKVWDVRAFRPLKEARLPGRAPAHLAFSQSGMLAVTCARSSCVEVYGAARKLRPAAPYLSHRLSDGATGCAAAFRPFEDVLLVGHSLGVDSILAPGSGEAAYDALEGTNPYRTGKQRQTATVRGLLDKLPPETIALGGAGFVGTVERDPAAADRERAALEREANAALSKKLEVKEKKKTRGRSKLRAKLKKRQKNVISKETQALKEKLREKELARKRKRGGGDADAGGDDAAPTTALDRLFARSRR